MQINIFGTDEDQALLWEVIFAIPGMRVWETYSRPGEQIREFDSFSEIDVAIERKHRVFSCWPATVGGQPEIVPIKFEAATVARYGHSGREWIKGPCLIQFNQQHTSHPTALNSCAISCWSVKGARSRSIYPSSTVDSINWTELKRVFSKLQRDFYKIAPAKLGTAVILPFAFRALEAEEISLWGWGNEVSISSPQLTIKH